MSQSGHIVAKSASRKVSSSEAKRRSGWLRAGAKAVPAETEPAAQADAKSEPLAPAQPAVVGLVTGLRVVTNRGRVTIGSLVAGDEVWTMDHGLRKLKWVVQRKIKFSGKTDHMRPVTLAAGAFGPGAPLEDLRVAPGQRLLINDWRAKHFFDLPEILVRAVDLVGQPGITRDVACDSEIYAYLHFDDFELIESSGVISESFLHERKRDLYKTGALRNAESVSPSRPLVEGARIKLLRQAGTQDPADGTARRKGGLRNFVAGHGSEPG